MYAGFCNAKGDYVAVIDADMQDPPSLLPEMVAYLESGEKSTEFVDATVYDKQDGKVYIDTLVFNPGDVILKPDSDETYTVSEKASLTGVYNMNNGYADFTKINVLYSNKEYSIVESGTNYGLRVYDHIVLDGESVNEDEFVFDTIRKEEK